MDPVHKLRSTRLVEYAFAPIPFRNSAPFCETFRDFWHKCGTKSLIVSLSRIFITPCRNSTCNFPSRKVPGFSPLSYATPEYRGLPAIQRRVNLRRGTEKTFLVFRLLHIRRIAPKPAPGAGINCTWYNYFPLFRLQPSFGLTPHSMHSTQKYVYYTLSKCVRQVLFEKFRKKPGRKTIGFAPTVWKHADY